MNSHPRMYCRYEATSCSPTLIIVLFLPPNVLGERRLRQTAGYGSNPAAGSSVRSTEKLDIRASLDLIDAVKH